MEDKEHHFRRLLKRGMSDFRLGDQGGMIIIGLGTGRSGTASLAGLLNAQANAICFHEMNPSCVRFAGTPRPIFNTIEEFQTIVEGGDPSMLTVDLSRRVAAEEYDQLCQMSKVTLIGDIAFYYLTYARDIAAKYKSVRFVCLKRDKEETVQSWMKKTAVKRWPSKRVADRLATLITREPYYKARNPWMEHDGTDWAVDPVWDKCYPKFPGPTKEAAIGQYWDYYYEEAEKLVSEIGDVFRIFPTEKLNIKEHQADLLSYCGINDADHVYTEAHIHRSDRS